MNSQYDKIVSFIIISLTVIVIGYMFASCVLIIDGVKNDINKRNEAYQMIGK